MGFFGYKNYIDASINSLLNQTYDDLKLIINEDDCGHDAKGLINRYDDNENKDFQGNIRHVWIQGIHQLKIG